MARQGRRVAQQEILSWLLDLGEAEKHRLGRGATRPMTPREMAGLKDLIVHTGIRTREEEIDEAVTRAVR